jgi:hypothetical protein
MNIKLVSTGFDRYYQVDGVKCPSVTQIISYHEDKKFLEDWKARNPLKAEVTSSSARMRGTNIHRALYNFHDNREKYNKIVANFSNEEKKYLVGYQDLLDITLVAEYLETKVAYLDTDGRGFGGKIDNVSLLSTSDFVYYKTDTPVFTNPQELFLIDYKNPNKAKQPVHLIGYCLQLSAYCAAFNFSTQLTRGLNKALLVIVSPRVTSYYYLNPMKLSMYWSIYKELLKGFYLKKKCDWKKMKESLGVYEDEERGYPRIAPNNFLPERIELKTKITQEEETYVSF